MAEEFRDELPEELDASGYVGPYTFPNNNRRRISAAIYALAGVMGIALFAIGGEGVLINRGFLLGGLFLLALACYHLAAGVTLRVNETDALVAASKTVGFAVGHASAQLSWRGLMSRPTWRILLYSADEPPTKRGLVLVDGVSGDVGDHIVEDNPEDWASYDS
jgi:hypothetical protein